MRAAQPHGTGRAEMWGWAMGGAPLLLLLLPGAVGLQCLSCGAEDESCSGAINVTCGPESDVCAEALASVTWSHGRLALGGRGCGRGHPGALAHALELAGVVAFVRRRQCGGGAGGGACNGALPVGSERALPEAANVTAQAPNGLRCFGCPDDGPCSAPTVVHCYGDLRGCFHGNVTVTLGGSRRWREVRGCARTPSCAPEPRGDAVVGLEGSCCAGDLCNGAGGNRSLFAPDLPRLELLPQPHGPSKGDGAAAATTKMAAPTATAAAPAGNASAARTEAAAARTEAAAATRSAAPTAAAAGPGGTDAASSGSGAEGPAANMAAPTGKMAAPTSKTAAGRAGRPLERAEDPVGRSQALGAGLWPFLLLLLLL
ncbi:ly6/PLAUR domain-containing protein 3-like [Guaruba guarouba]